MANAKNFTSKNLSIQIENLLKIGKVDLVVDILKAKEIQNLLQNILKILKRKSDKKEDFEKTKIYSKTSLNKNILEKLQEILKIDTENSQIIIDKNLSAGIKIKSGGKVVDATLETMLENEIAKII